MSIDIAPAGYEEWMEESACSRIDPEKWFPEVGAGAGNYAKKVCNTICPVRAECLSFALDQVPAPHGIWGGLGEKARAKLAKERREAA